MDPMGLPVPLEVVLHGMYMDRVTLSAFLHLKRGRHTNGGPDDRKWTYNPLFPLPCILGSSSVAWGQNSYSLMLTGNAVIIVCDCRGQPGGGGGGGGGILD